MYNGIGLKTARGTGTNGYIQRNLSNVRPRDNPFTKPAASSSAPDVRHTQPDAAILEHERKRRVEVRCMELRVQLEDDDVHDDEIELQVQALREKLTAQMEQQREQEAVSKIDAAKLRAGDTHRLAEAKQHDERRFARAVGVESGYREGDAFDRELQERKKQERIEERRRRDEERRKEWERRKEQQADARRERERAGEERDAGWSRRREREEKVRSPSPRARKRGKYSESSGSDSGSSERSPRRRDEGRSSFTSSSRSRSRSTTRSRYDSRSRSRSKSRSRSRSVSHSRSRSVSSRSHSGGRRRSYSRSPSRSASSRSLSRSVSRSRSASPARALPPGPPPTRPPGL
ncbi:uncharacterized protein PSANT_06890 [Moesziomyces antarcticus]|uniref:CWF21 domain-containing protein n=1 Tax=Pseudozyma antarctica TaxID=84753 RepID=A0A5C3G042_PSEA2|nr:uncharacterized protein PSANT_06890 [Moesziomyces antarcticus]